MRCVLCGELGYTVPFGVAQIGVRDDEPVEYACLAGCAGHEVESGLGVLARAGVHQDDVAVGQSRRYGGGRITGSAARQSGSSLAYRKSAHGFSGVLIALTVRWCRCGGGGGTRRWRLPSRGRCWVGEFIGRVGVCGLGGGELEPGAFGVVGECPNRAGAAGVDAGVAVPRAVDGEAVVSASRELVRRVGDRDGGGHDAALDVAVAEVRVLMRSGRKPDQWCRD